MMNKCLACGLCQTAKNVRIEGWGSRDASVLIVAGKPSKDDDKAGKSLQGKTGTYLKTLLRTAGIDTSVCFFTSAIKCFSDGDDKETDKAAFNICPDQWLFKEIQIIKPKVIVALGNDAYQILTGNKSVDKDRGSLVIRDFGPVSCYVIPVYSPYFLMQQSDKSKNVTQTIEDLRKIPNILNGSFGMWNDADLTNGKLDYQIVDTVTKLQDIVQEVYKAGVLAADIECRKLDPYRVEKDCVGKGYPFVSLQFSYMEGQAFFLPWANVEFQSEDNEEGYFFSEEDREKVKAILKDLLEDPEDKVTLVGHNFKFDSKWIMKWLGITPRLDYDTMVAASFLGEASNRLKKIAWHWTPMGGYEAKQDEFTQQMAVDDRWDMFKYPCDVLVPYGCADADATLRIYNQFVKKGIVNPDNQRVFDIIVTASRVFADIENDGIHIDTPYLTKLKEDLTLDLKRVEEEFRMEASEDIAFLDKQIYTESLGKKGKPLKHKNTEFMISSNDHISRLFYGRLGMEINEQHRSKKTQDASTGSAALKELAPKYPIAGKLLEWRKISKQISGFVDAYPSFIDFEDRIHPTYSLVQYETDSGDESGTITGRTSCSDPNLQQVPSRGDGKKIKKLFIPDCSDHMFVDCLVPGTRVLTSDFIWKSIETLSIGDILVGFDSVLNKHTKLRKSMVERIEFRNSIRYRVTTDKGIVECSDTHMWPSFKVYASGGYGKRVWTQTRSLIVGNKISYLISPWSTTSTFEDGWMSGLLDGEGWVSNRGGCGIGQNPGFLLNKIKEQLTKDGFVFNEYIPKASRCVHLEMTGAFTPMRLLGKYQPCRLKNKYTFEGMRSWSRNTEPATILNVERIEDGPVVSVKTSTGTFIAEGFFSHNCDFSGIELRVAAMHSQDVRMKEFFNSGKGDFHRYAASLIYGVPEDQVTEDPQRRIAKTFNFALLYGAGPMKLSQTAGISLAEAEAFIKAYFKNFPALAEWIRGQHRFAKMYGYVKSMFGRVRYLPDAQLDTRDFGNKIKMEAALKRAVNTPVQADASDLTLYSLGRIWDYLNKFEHSDPKWPSRLRGSVHDSILMSVHVNDLPEIVSHIKYEILEKPQLDFIVEKGVALRADCSIGPNWGEQSDLDFGD